MRKLARLADKGVGLQVGKRKKTVENSHKRGIGQSKARPPEGSELKRDQQRLASWRSACVGRQRS